MANRSMLVRSNTFHVDYKDIVLPEKEPLLHYHDALELAYFVRADIRVEVGDRSYLLEDGDIMLLDKFDRHRIEYPAGQLYTRYVVNFSEDFAEPAMEAVGLGGLLKELLACGDAKVRTSDGTQREQLDRILSSLWTMSQTPPDEKGREAFFRLQTGSLLLLFQSLPVKAEANKPAAQTEIAQRVMAYLDDCFRDGLSLDTLARHFHLSKYYLGHAFKEATRMTMNDYVQIKRVAEAKHHLKHSDKSVLEVSLECGFNSVQHFHRVFKKLTRQTPYQYKRLT